MVSMVAMRPSSAKVASSSGVAVFSLDFPAVARCPITAPAPAAKALTRCGGWHPPSRSTDWSCRRERRRYAPPRPEYPAKPAPKGRFEFVRIDPEEQPAERVVRREPRFRLEISAQPVQLLLGPRFNLDEGIVSDQDRIDRHHGQFNQIMFDLPITSTVTMQPSGARPTEQRRWHSPCGCTGCAGRTARSARSATLRGNAAGQPAGAGG